MKLLDFIYKIGEDINIRVVNNGYLLEVSGRNAQEDWTAVKLVCLNRKDLDSLLDQCFALPRDN